MVLGVLAGLAIAAAQARVVPPTARPGDAVLVEVRGAREAPEGDLAGRALQFFRAPDGTWRAFVGLPVEAELGETTAAVRIPRAGAAPRTVEARLRIVDPRWAERQLTVPPRFTDEKPPEVVERVEADRLAFLAAFAQPRSAPLFARPFAWPRNAPVIARFGDLRVFNGQAQGQHYGIDLRGPVGAAVGAANDGEVVLVRDGWASGLSVVLFHGAGLYTVYFHLSEATVRAGDRVRRGQRIGLLGASGRASGPHLHWGARVDDLYVDPDSLLRLTRSWPRAPAR